MSRSTRLRTQQSRYRTEDPPPEVVKPSSKPRKGNQKPQKDILTELRSPVLRDRTNLMVESSKNVISKKGIGDKRLNTNPETKISTRGAKTKKTLASDDDNGDKRTIVTRTTRNLPSPEIKKHPPVPSRSSKNPGIQVTEKEPEDAEKPTKFPTKIPRKVSKTTKTPNSLSKPNSPKTTKSAVVTRPRDREEPKDLPRTTRSKKSSAATSKPPKSPEKIERKSKRLTKPSAKSPQKSEKKFFKNKRNITLTHSKVSPMKRGLRIPRKPLRKKTSSSKLYQPTLAESFAKVKKTLRPRRTGKDYNEETIVESKKPEIGGTQPPKAPVYKTLNIQNVNPKDKEEIYEFSFDANDSKERLQKKRKKNTVRKAPAKRAKKTVEKAPQNPRKAVKKDGAVNPKAIPTASKPQNLEKEITKTNGKIPEAKFVLKTDKNAMGSDSGGLGEAPRLDEPLKNPQTALEDRQTPQEAPPSPCQSSRGNSPIPEHFEVTVDVHAPSDVPSTTPTLPRIPSATPKTPLVQTKRVRMVADEKLDGERRISLTSTPLHAPSDSIGPTSNFTNRPSTHYKTMMNHSLIRRSFSPIVKETNPKIDANFDPSSPWRPIVANTFSRVKNVFQSTPQGKKVLTPHGIKSLTTENKRVMGKINKIVEEGNMSSVTESPKKSPRKFGTLLGNVSSPGSINSRKSGGSSVEDKENLVSSRKSPVKSPVKSPMKSPVKSPSKRIRTLLESPLKPLDNELTREETSKQEEEKVVRQEKVLRQSNLNGFLGIPEMPASTSISTAHGIFDDGERIVPGKSLRRPTDDFSVRNAFGFEEESCWEQDESSGVGNFAGDTPEVDSVQKKVDVGIKMQKNLVIEVNVQKITEKIQKKVDGENVEREVDAGEKIQKVQKKILEVKRSLRMPTRAVQKVEVEDLNKIERAKEKEEGDEERVEVSSGDVSENDEDEECVTSNIETHEATKKDLVEAVHFLDTFDAEEQETNPVEVPLFVDPEPVHFRQPPRFSYGKRKRLHHNTSDETEDFHSDEEEDDDHPKRKPKKRKMTKAEKEQQKKLDEWAKSVNQTFDEIEHFDLVVE